MDLTEELLRSLLGEIAGGHVLAYDGHELDFGNIARRSMIEAVSDATGKSTAEIADPDRLAELARGMKLAVEPHWQWGRLLMEVFEARVEANLVQPTFITHHPAEVSPLARRNAANPLVTDRFELFAAGREIANGFSELNDPDDQAERFRLQVALKDKGDLEAMHYDQDFVTALEYGMSPTAGEGIGIDRLAMLLTGRTTIRDVVLFPQMRATGEQQA